MQYRKLSELKKLEGNPRTINKDDFEKLEKSIKDNPDYFEARPLILSDRTGDLVIIGGNQRYEAAKSLQLEKVPTHLLKNLTEAREREIVIRDNINNGQFDWDLLANSWSDDPLDDWGVDLPNSWKQEEVEEDESPEVDETGPPKSQIGKIYQLGKHRVMCGSATDETDVNLLFGEQSIDLFLTDPPYNVDYTGKTKDALKIENDSKDDIEFLAFLTDANRRADEHMKSGASFYIFHADLEGYNFRASVKAVGWLLKQNLIWVKNSMVMGRQDYQWKHEPILYGWKSGASHSWYTDRKQTTLLEFDRPSRSTDHPTMKPISILAYLIGNSSKAGDLIYDSFSGSGSTLIACEQTTRICYGMELDPKYVDVIRKRWAKFTKLESWETDWEQLTPSLKE